MRPDAKIQKPRGENVIAVDWRICAWCPRIVVQTSSRPNRRPATKPLLVSSSFLHTPRRNSNYFKTMKIILPHSRRHRAFTLVELLVVISIIAILAAMLLPVLAAVKKHALVVKAQLQVNDLATAIEGYDSAYGRFPVSTNAQIAASAANGDFTYGGTFQTNGGAYIVQNPATYTYQANNAEVIAILMDITNTDVTAVNANHQKNPQQTKFLSATMASDAKSPGVGTDLVYRDPWGNPYIITMDLNYDDQCKDAFYCLQKVSQQNGQTGYNGLFNSDPGGTSDNFQYHGKVMVWSMGPPVNGKVTIDPGGPATDSANKSHILSWQ
jgi:prepilin-type N-terminal cleavage/methylation domain-containing protein